MSQYAAAESCGVSARTIRVWRKKDPELDWMVREASCRATDQVEAMTYNKCLDPDPANNALRIFWLKTRSRKKFGQGPHGSDRVLSGNAQEIRIILMDRPSKIELENLNKSSESESIANESEKVADAPNG